MGPTEMEMKNRRAAMRKRPPRSRITSFFTGDIVLGFVPACHESKNPSVFSNSLVTVPASFPPRISVTLPSFSSIRIGSLGRKPPRLPSPRWSGYLQSGQTPIAEAYDHEHRLEEIAAHLGIHYATASRRLKEIEQAR
jgi:hypothetical protein